MTLQELETYFYSFLQIDEYSGDPSRNGVQVENSNPAGKEIKKVAFAVDADHCPVPELIVVIWKFCCRFRPAGVYCGRRIGL